MNKTFLILCSISILVFTSCKKVDPNERNLNAICEAFSYSDTVFYINDGASYKILPLQNLNGIFSSIPEGLALDSLTGEIDINASETGLRYRVSFSPANSDQSCELDIVISGVNYLDKIYVIDQQERIAFPVFNGDSSGVSPCPEDDDDDDDDDCKFDEDGPDGTDLSDIGIEVSASTGEIDLEQTILNSAFGINPANGAILDATMYYRLNDSSLKALNSIAIRLFYFETLTDVPQSLIDEIEDKNKQILRVNTPNSYINARLAQDNLSVKPRPPYLIIVARLQ